MPDDLLKEQIKTQIEITKDFTKELVYINKLLKELKENDGEILTKLQNGIVDKIEDKINSKLNILYWKLVGSVGVITALFSFIVYLIKN